MIHSQRFVHPTPACHLAPRRGKQTRHKSRQQSSKNNEKRTKSQGSSRRNIVKNESLKKALDVSYLNNYLISRENNFYKDKNVLKHPFEHNSFTNYSVAELKNLDPNVFNCCDKHRMYIEVISDIKQAAKVQKILDMCIKSNDKNQWVDIN